MARGCSSARRAIKQTTHANIATWLAGPPRSRSEPPEDTIVAAAAFTTPTLKSYPVIPLLQVGAMAHSRPYVASALIQKAIGFPAELVDDWQSVAIAKIGKVLRIRNNLGIPGPAVENTLQGLEEDTKEETGVDVRFPLNVKGTEVLLITPSADFFSEPHVESLIGYAKVFHAAGISWTLSSHASEAGNFGLFIGNYEQMRNISLRVREAALELGVKRIIVGECGHAWRVAYSYWNTLIGPFDWLDPRYPVPQHICEFTHDLIQRGALRMDKDANDERIVTFHDSCNVARASRMGSMPGGQFVIPREII